MLEQMFSVAAVAFLLTALLGAVAILGAVGTVLGLCWSAGKVVAYFFQDRALSDAKFGILCIAGAAVLSITVLATVICYAAGYWIVDQLHGWLPR